MVSCTGETGHEIDTDAAYLRDRSMAETVGLGADATDSNRCTVALGNSKDASRLMDSCHQSRAVDGCPPIAAAVRHTLGSATRIR